MPSDAPEVKWIFPPPTPPLGIEQPSSSRTSSPSGPLDFIHAPHPYDRGPLDWQQMKEPAPNFDELCEEARTAARHPLGAPSRPTPIPGGSRPSTAIMIRGLPPAAEPVPPIPHDLMSAVDALVTSPPRSPALSDGRVTPPPRDNDGDSPIQAPSPRTVAQRTSPVPRLEELAEAVVEPTSTQRTAPAPASTLQWLTGVQYRATYSEHDQHLGLPYYSDEDTNTLGLRYYSPEPSPPYFTAAVAAPGTGPAAGSGPATGPPIPTGATAFPAIGPGFPPGPSGYRYHGAAPIPISWPAGTAGYPCPSPILSGSSGHRSPINQASNAPSPNILHANLVTNSHLQTRLSTPADDREDRVRNLLAEWRTMSMGAPQNQEQEHFNLAAAVANSPVPAPMLSHRPAQFPAHPASSTRWRSVKVNPMPPRQAAAVPQQLRKAPYSTLKVQIPGPLPLPPPLRAQTAKGATSSASSASPAPSPVPPASGPSGSRPVGAVMSPSASGSVHSAPRSPELRTELNHLAGNALARKRLSTQEHPQPKQEVTQPAQKQSQRQLLDRHKKLVATRHAPAPPVVTRATVSVGGSATHGGKFACPPAPPPTPISTATFGPVRQPAPPPIPISPPPGFDVVCQPVPAENGKGVFRSLRQPIPAGEGKGFNKTCTTPGPVRATDRLLLCSGPPQPLRIMTPGLIKPGAL